MKLRCQKCGTDIPIPPEVTRAPVPRVECPGCHSGYRLRPRRKSRPPTSAPAAPATPAGAATPPDLHEAPTVVAGRSQPAAPAGFGRVFEPGEQVGGRYRIVRFLAVGGMGEVYEAEDEELLTRVALKTIHAHAGGDASHLERFKREIHLARQVTHPNVCRIYDLGRHRPESGAPAVRFLTMELLEGETLSDRLARQGRLSTAEALPLLGQMAAALDAAHGAGVVHRDFKSENVYLVEREGQIRAVVTDFGVARGHGVDDRFATRTGTAVVGTPAYMAPEQVEGGPITPAADVYALGIVLYEMLTGRVPFTGENPLTTAVKRLQEAPTPPHAHVPDLEPRWERAILRCLERRPEDRPASAGEVLEAVKASRPERPAGDGRADAAPAPRPATAAPPPRQAPPEAPSAGPPATRPRRRRELALLALLVVVALAAWALRDRWGDGTRPRRTVAVLGFHNTTGREEVAWLSTALAEMLGTELARGESLRTIPGENVARMKRELALGDLDALGAESLRRVRGLLGCDFVVLGSYVAVDGGGGRQIRLDLRLQDAALGETVHSLAEAGGESELFDLVTAVGGELREHLGAAVARGEEAEAGLPADPEAARLYAEALDDLRRGEPLSARERLEAAVRREPGRALLHSALASAWQALGYDQKAAEQAHRAFELSGTLGREERMVIEARYRDAVGDHLEAVEAWAALWRLFPDNLEYGLRLAAAETAAHRPQEALATVAELRALPEPAAGDPRIDLAEASVVGLVSDFERQLAATERAAAAAHEVGASLLVAQARLIEANARRFLGQPAEAEAAAREALEVYRRIASPAGAAEALTALGNAAFDRGELEAAEERYLEALEIYRDAGDQGGLASSLNNRALALKQRGELGRAEELYREAEVIYREIGDRHGIANTENNLAAILYGRDRLGEARALFERVVAAWEELGERASIANGLNNLAVVLRLEGRLEASRELHQRALEIRRETGQKAGEVASLTNLAAVLVDLGELAEAAAHLEQARSLGEALGQPAVRAGTLHASGRLQLLRGELAGARAELEEALEIRRQLEARRALVDTRLAFARLLLEEGHAAAAEVEARVIALDCAQEGRRSDEARAGALIVRAHLADGRVAEARRALAEAAAAGAGSEQPRVHLELALLDARLDAAEGRPAEALEGLREVAALAGRTGHAEPAMEAELRSAEAELAIGRSEAARARLLALEERAALAGFAPLAERAGALLPPAPAQPAAGAA